MAKQTFQELSSEIVTKAKNGTLTVGEAIDFASDSRVPMPEGYNKNKKGEYPARKNIQTLKRSLSVLQKKAPDAFPLGENTPLKDMRQPEVVFLFRRDGSPDMSNRAYGYQQFENIFFGSLKGKRVERLSEFIDGNEEDMYPRLAGSGNPMGTQRTGLAGERPMQGTLPKADLDSIYDEALPEIAANYDQKTARLIEYHRTTFQRPEQLLGLKVSDVKVTGDTITIKGKNTTSTDHKGRPELRFKSNSPTGELLLQALNDESISSVGNDRSLFGVDVKSFDDAFNNHIGTRLEKFSDVLPLADIKIEEGGKVVRIDQKPVTTPSAIRSIVPHYMLKDMKVNRDIVQGLMGHKPNDELGKNYTGVIINEELPNVLQNPEAFAETGFSTSKGGQVGLDTNLLDDDQLAKLSDEYLDTQTAEMKARTATAQATTVEMDVRKQDATIQRAAGMDEEVKAAATIAEGEAQINLTQNQARGAAKKTADVATGQSLIDKAFSMAKPSKNTLKTSALAVAGTLGAIPGPAGDLIGLGIESAFADPSDGPNRFDVAEERGRQAAADLFGIPRKAGDKGLATSGGALVATAGELFGVGIPPKVPTDIQRMRARQPAAPSAGDEFGNLDQQGQPTPSAPVNIPDPVPTQQGMLAAGGAKQRVNQARSAALAGKETSMSGSFLN